MTTTINKSSLIQPIKNCFEEMKVQLSLQLPPMDTNNIVNGTKSMLDRLVFKFKPELGGIIISYYDVVHVDNEARIFYDSPYLGIKIQVKFLVFKPFKNQILNGVVKRVSSTHISLLVFGIISASISKSSIPKSFAFDHSSNMFVNKQNKATISVGTKIAFKVQDVNADRHNIGIQGDMNDLNSTGIIGFEEGVQFTSNNNNNNNKFNSNQSTPNKSSPIKKEDNNNNNSITRFDSSDEDSDDEKVEDKKEKVVEKVQVKKDDKKKVESESESESESASASASASESEPESSSESESSEDEKNKKKKKAVDSKKRKKDESSNESESSQDEKDKKKKKSTKSTKKSKVESSDSSSSESSSSEDDKKKKKKK